MRGGPTQAQGQRPVGLVGQGAERQEGAVVMVMGVLVPPASESPLAPRGVLGLVLIGRADPAHVLWPFRQGGRLNQAPAEGPTFLSGRCTEIQTVFPLSLPTPILCVLAKGQQLFLDPISPLF